jgi:hypothetical protein
MTRNFKYYYMVLFGYEFYNINLLNIFLKNKNCMNPIESNFIVAFSVCRINKAEIECKISCLKYD